MELDKLNKFDGDPSPLSGAYIRSLVKQLTTGTSKPKDQGCVGVDTSVFRSRSLRKHGKILGAQPTQQQHKKQVRRRLHTSKPYHERLLNMAEARKEIVTALKLHRSAMRQATEQQQQHQQQQQQQLPIQEQQQPSESFQFSHQTCFEEDGNFKSRRNSRTLSSCMNNFPSNIMDDFFSYSSSLSHVPLPSIPNSCTLPVASPIAPPPLVAENSNLTLPNQTLGLNLNLHDFNYLDDTFFLHNDNNSPSFSYSSPSPSSPPLSIVAHQEVPSIGKKEGVSSMVDTIESMAKSQVGDGLHTTIDDKGIEEIRSLGEQYQMELNDTMNLVTSAWWFKFLKNMEHDAPEEHNTQEHNSSNIFQ